MPKPKPKLELNSGGNYAAHLYGTIIGHIGKGDKLWHATLGEFDLGNHKTRRDALDAMLDVYFT